jgi:hypothetical protein
LTSLLRARLRADATLPLLTRSRHRARSSALANSAEISSTDLRHGAAFDNIKATWNQALKFGKRETNLKAGYDYSANRDFLKEVSLSGDMMDGDDMRVSYDVSHDFAASNTNVKLTANAKGTKLGAEYDRAEGLKEVSLDRDVDIGDQSLNVQPSWLVAAHTARIKLMSKLGGGKDQLSAQFDYDTSDKAASYEIGYGHDFGEGRDVSATVKPNKREVEVDYVDNTFESGATWTASASMPFDGDSKMLDATKLTLKRSWKW